MIKLLWFLGNKSEKERKISVLITNSNQVKNFILAVLRQEGVNLELKSLFIFFCMCVNIYNNNNNKTFSL